MLLRAIREQIQELVDAKAVIDAARKEQPSGYSQMSTFYLLTKLNGKRNVCVSDRITMHEAIKIMENISIL